MAVDVGTGVKEPAVSEAGRGAPDGEKFGQGRVLSAIAEQLWLLRTSRIPTIVFWTDMIFCKE